MTAEVMARATTPRRYVETCAVSVPILRRKGDARRSQKASDEHVEQDASGEPALHADAVLAPNPGDRLKPVTDRP